ncbi:F-box only protein 21-like isoform X1 [Linepithema humile]|uniref:F-box only protein 21-like isoform X1 n=1 Tax=Linepithema humile TaxID=83485 RepID=UPI00351DD660
MATIMDLPYGVISIILCDESISIMDTLNFALTCKGFNKIINDNVLWRIKFYQRMLFFRKDIEKCFGIEDIDFLKQLRAISINSKKELEHYVSLVYKKQYYKKAIHHNLFDDLMCFQIVMHSNHTASFINYYFSIYELIKLLVQHSMEYNIRQGQNLLSYLQFYRLRSVWDKFMNYPKQQQILEDAAVILVHLYQPLNFLSSRSVRRSLDNIAQHVLEYLKNECPTHSIFSISAEQFSFWKYNNIDDNHWNNTEARQILESLCKVLHNKLGFRENSILRKFEKCWGPEILKNEFRIGLPLGIIYHGVARRLGVRCDLVHSPFHFLCWKLKYSNANLKDEEHFYIDVLHCDSFPNKYCKIEDSIIDLTKMEPKVLKLLHDDFKYQRIHFLEVPEKFEGNAFNDADVADDINVSNYIKRIYPIAEL